MCLTRWFVACFVFRTPRIVAGTVAIHAVVYLVFFFREGRVLAHYGISLTRWFVACSLFFREPRLVVGTVVIKRGSLSRFVFVKSVSLLTTALV